MSLVLFGISKVMPAAIFLLIGFGAGRVVRDYALFVVVPALVVSTLWNWFVKWRFPEYRTSDYGCDSSVRATSRPGS